MEDICDCALDLMEASKKVLRDPVTKKPVQKSVAQLAAKLRECEGAIRNMLDITDVERADERARRPRES